MRRRATLALALGVLLGGCVPPDACGSGASSPTAAVDELLHAAAEQDASRACAVTLAGSDDGLGPEVADLAAFLADAGGPDAVVVREVPDRQMGSAHLVAVLVPDSPGRVELTVLQSGGRYVVAVGGQPPGADDTTDPRPRPTGEATGPGT